MISNLSPPPSPLPSIQENATSPPLVEEANRGPNADGSYDVQQIVDRRLIRVKGGRRRLVQYRVHWATWSPADNTWECMDYLENSTGAIQDYERLSPEAKQALRKAQFEAGDTELMEGAANSEQDFTADSLCEHFINDSNFLQPKKVLQRYRTRVDVEIPSESYLIQTTEGFLVEIKSTQIDAIKCQIKKKRLLELIVKADMEEMLREKEKEKEKDKEKDKKEPQLMSEEEEVNDEGDDRME
ncbi:hypothetical protein TYRP_011643 [Tyrophagus putrescentiae]|nr:hypothetical protein TYRP_011643 [Tyrophagus putrescentiae]